MAGFIDKVFSRLGYARINNTLTASNPRVQLENNPRNYFELLWAYYCNNSLYDEATRIMRQVVSNGEPVKPLRNPANRVVEFYAMTIWAGNLPKALPIVTDNELIIDPINQLWQWSNWSQKKQAAIRQFAATGDMFIKVSQREDNRPYLQTIKAQQVSDLELDERDFVTKIRIDTPINKSITKRTRTEYWTLDGVTVWEHNRGDAPIEQLGEPLADDTMTMAETGIDFIPVAFGKFRDVGELHGQGAFVHALDKIDEINRTATRLNSVAFKHSKVLWALMSNNKDGNGRPLPAVSLTGEDGKTKMSLADLEREAMVELPGGNSIESLIPNLPYDKILAVLNASMEDLRADLPELLYWDMSDTVSKDASGASIRTRLASALSRASEARGNAERVLVRAQQMALTIGQAAGIWKGLGTYDEGALDHTFAERDILALDSDVKAAIEKSTWDAAKVAQSVGVPLDVFLRRQGWDEQAIKKIVDSPDYRNRQDATLTAINPARRPV